MSNGVIKEQIVLSGVEDSAPIKARLTFPNPKYLEALEQGRYSGNLDRTIELFEERGDELIVPYGCRAWLDFPLEDRTETAPVEIPFQGELRDYQNRAVNALCEAQFGVFVASTGSGKTCSAIALAARLGQRSLILVKSTALAEQWREAIRKFTGLESGLIGGGNDSEGSEFTVALVQTLHNREPLRGYGCVIVDESHNTPALTAYEVVTNSLARYRFGLSATPERRDGLEPVLFAALGPITARIDESELEGAVLPVRVASLHREWSGGEVDGWSGFIKALSTDPARNAMLAESATKAAGFGPTILLCSTIEQCDLLAALLPEALVLHGQLSKKDREAKMKLAPTAQIIIGTLSLLSEGIDLPHLGNLIFASPVSAQVDRETPAATRLIQSIGRVRRPFPGKSCAYVMDVVDQHPLGLSAARKRGEIFNLRGFKRCVMKR